MSLSCAAIIFDLDGVLVDSAAAIEQRWRDWAEARDIPFEEVEAVYHGRPMLEVIQEVAPHLDAKAETERTDEEIRLRTELLTAFDGAAPLLERLPKERWAIATSGRRRTASTRLVEVELPRPETFVTADDVESGKPAPDPYLLAAEGLGMQPERCLVFEDAPAGVAAAQRAGARVVGVATTHPPETLTAATAVVPSIGAVEIESDATGMLHVWDRQTRPASSSGPR